MFTRFLFILFLAISPTLSWACASCGCTLSSDWGDPSRLGLSLDLRYDYINQNQLRSGTSSISPNAASKKTNNGNPQEVETYTKNNYITAIADYSFDPSWKLSLQIPYVLRDHATLGTASDGSNAGAGGGQYNSSTSNLGDIKLLGKFQGFTPEHNFGAILGAKLPSGKFKLKGNSTDSSAPGPVNIDRGLQPGTGTTDLIFGAYYNEALNKNWDHFEEALYQVALNKRDQYSPGNALNVNLGLRYFGLNYLKPQIQINTRYVQSDRGLNADTFSTGGTLVYLSPGLNIPLSNAVEVYSFVQVPLYQKLLGVQLTPKYTASLGARYIF